MRSSRIIALAAISGALLATSGLATTASAARHVTPLPGQHGPNLETIHTPFLAPKKSGSGTWAALVHAFPGSGFPDTAVQLTDGSVLMHDGCTTNWYKLTPDNTGSYHNGTWSSIASMPTGYSPLYFSSQVLPDGHVIVEGGEYINCNAVWSTLGAIYNTKTNTWTAVVPPTGWTSIGDAQSVVRHDGVYQQADCCSTKAALASISGDVVTWTSVGTGKVDSNDEEGWTQLPDQTILTVDANRGLGNPNFVEIFDENTNTWATQTNKTPASCVDAGSHEVGPGVLLHSGLMFQVCATAHTAIYDPIAKTWAAGPDMPTINGALDSADGPAVEMPSGNILAQVSPGVFNTPSHFVEIKVTDASTATITQVNEPASAASQSSYEGRLMMLPTGQVLWSSDVGDVQIYTPKGKTVKSAIPKLSIPASLTVGSNNNKAKGKGFNGASYGGYYGDDAQMSTNYPLIRFTNNSSGHVCYAKTHDYNTGVGNGGNKSKAQFDIPGSCETGASTAQVVVNGIASKPVAVTLN
jgi:hypothetical protein